MTQLHPATSANFLCTSKNKLKTINDPSWSIAYRSLIKKFCLVSITHTFLQYIHQTYEQEQFIVVIMPPLNQHSTCGLKHLISQSQHSKIKTFEEPQPQTDSKSKKCVTKLKWPQNGFLKTRVSRTLRTASEVTDAGPLTCGLVSKIQFKNTFL